MASAKTWGTGFAALVIAAGLSALSAWQLTAHKTMADEDVEGYLLSYAKFCSATVNPHPDGIKHQEHDAMLEMVPASAVSFIATRSGEWSSKDTWAKGEVPQAGAKVLIPEDVVVTYDSAQGEDLNWVRVDGTLDFTSKTSSEMRVANLIITPTGTLNVGAPETPISKDILTQVTFLPRDETLRNADLLDLGGGLISHGKVIIQGASKTPYTYSDGELNLTNTITLSEAPENWRAGDKILIPGVNLLADEDETFTITHLSDSGKKIHLNDSIKYSHALPEGFAPVPIANLTRNVRFKSASVEKNTDRAHVMIMHHAQAAQIANASFVDLGRTRSETAFTIPRLDENGLPVAGSRDNTKGRYALHFHVRSGASYDQDPHRVSGTVITGSPRHGLVNHGGYVNAENNIGFQNAGSHFYSENGTELGAFRGNLAIRSAGSGTPENTNLKSREGTQDYGFGGHGFWLASSAVELTNNFASGHAFSGITVFGYPIKDDGERIYFDPENLRGGDVETQHTKIRISNVSFNLSHNQVVNGGTGLDIRQHKMSSDNDTISKVSGLSVYNVGHYSVSIPYTKNVRFDNIDLVQDLTVNRGMAFRTNSLTENIGITNTRAEGFIVGMVMPTRGVNQISQAKFNNTINFEIPVLTRPNRVLDFHNVDISGRREGRDQGFRPADYVMKDGNLPLHGDMTLLFEPDYIFTRSDTTGVQRLAFPSQLEDQSVFSDKDSPQLAGLTTGQIKAQFGLSLGGMVVASSTPKVALGNAHVVKDYNLSDVTNAKSVSRQTAQYMADANGQYAPKTGKQAFTYKFKFQYPGAWKNFRAAEDVSEDSLNETQQWAGLSAQKSSGELPTFIDSEKPYFALQPSLQNLKIHPDDVQYGYRVMGRVYDRVGKYMTVRAFTKDFHSLKVQDGQIQVPFDIHDMAGNELPVTLNLSVDETATRRLNNLDFFTNSDSYLAEFDTMDAMAFSALGEDLILTTKQKDYRTY